MEKVGKPKAGKTTRAFYIGRFEKYILLGIHLTKATDDLLSNE
jgi:hypothetical protein